MPSHSSCVMLGHNSQPPFILTSHMSHHTFTSRLLILLVLSFSTIGQAYGQHTSMPQSLLELQHSPAPYECAVLSAHVYGEDLQEGDPVVWMDPHTQQVHALHGWAVYKILTENHEDLLSKAFQQLGLPYGYRGVIYLNARKKQLVLGIVVISIYNCVLKQPN